MLINNMEISQENIFKWNYNKGHIEHCLIAEDKKYYYTI
jgi:hypothetical protein